MSETTKVHTVLPFEPRAWQRPLIEDRARIIVAVVHRRAGKSGLGALLLAVFVSAMLDPRPSRSAAAAERAHSDDGCDHLIDGTMQPGVA
jgi:hypothetical protein